jgi:uncharacterized membrane protein YgcG
MAARDARNRDHTHAERKLIRLFAGLIFCLFYVAAPLFAGENERITDFRSYISVHPDASITVTEEIKVYASGRNIRHGIYRVFPTRYRDREGNIFRVPFKTLSVKKNGNPEPYLVKNAPNGKRIRIGHKDVLLKPGFYTYTITYFTGRRIGFFKGYDELYWNATGNDWDFSIERAEAVVRIPEGGSILQKAAYTGYQGQRGKDFVIDSEDNTSIRFSTTRPLKPREGLTIALAWPKGLVPEPTAAQKRWYRITAVGYKFWYCVNANRLLSLSTAGFFLVFLYYLLTWFHVGRDPRRGTIIPLFEPPKGITPAAARYLTKQCYDDKTLSVAVLNMAVKGYLKIVEEKENQFTLVRVSKDTGTLSSHERKIAEHLFGGSDRLVLTQENHEKIGKAGEALEKGLKAAFAGTHFLTNGRYFLPGFIITVIMFAAVILAVQNGLRIVGIGFAVLIFLVLCAAFVQGLRQLRRTARKSEEPLQRFLSFVFLGTASFVLFGWLLIFVLLLISAPYELLAAVKCLKSMDWTKIAAGALLMIMLLLNLFFSYWLGAPTRLGRMILDRIEGFRLYLSKAEAHRLEIIHPPETTPELFERYLPYAVALDVEHEWSEQFSGVLAAAGQDMREYSPAWYGGGSFRDFRETGFTPNFASTFSDAVTSSSHAPNSGTGSRDWGSSGSHGGGSSGSGGGGSSGGGGGGGGGGGW